MKPKLDMKLMEIQWFFGEFVSLSTVWLKILLLSLASESFLACLSLSVLLALFLL